jgi:ribosomal-protein-alanine N-acetyltransferase
MTRALIAGSAVVLARPREADEAEFLTKVNDSADLHQEWVVPPATPEDFAAYLRRLRKRDTAGFLVREGITNAICGVVNVNNIVRGAFDSGYLGYYAFAVGAGRGYMTEGLQLACTYAFETIGLHRLEANIQPGNTRSIALVRRCGFRKEGFSLRYLRIGDEWRDHERWAITVEDVQGL